MSMATIKLSETTKFIVDNRGKTVPTADTGIPLIATNCIDNRNLYPIYEKLRYVSQDTYDNWFRSHPKPMDIILTLKGSQNGAVNLVPDPVDFCIAQDMVALRVDETQIDNLYLFAALRSEDIQDQIKTLDVSGVIPHFKKSDFDKLEIPLPPRPLQEIIGKTYFDLCNKIDLLHRQNKTLEAMAETLFRQWFIEDTAGKTELITLGEMIEIHDSKRIPLSKLERDKKKNGSIMYPYYGAAKIMDYVDDYIFDGDYLLLGEDGTVQDENGYPILQRANGKFWVNNHSHVLSAKAPYNNFFLWCLLSKTNIEKAVTGAVQPKINQENLRKLDFVKFDESKVLDFNDITSSMLNKLNTNNLQIQTIEKLRDTLLPKLMSGEVRVQYQTEQIA
ncbi:MAG TPA: restriction endonuclease subunit S [Streptococcus parasuis]|nr:restriction endonuclease subunit S [Streptococcus parasuis]